MRWTPARRSRTGREGHRSSGMADVWPTASPPASPPASSRRDPATHAAESLLLLVRRGLRRVRGMRLAVLRVMRCRPVMLGQDVLPPVALEVAPHAVDVVRAVLRVVVLDQERRALDAVVV